MQIILLRNQVKKEVKNMETTIDKIYEQDFKSQPLYRNQFNLDDKEWARYLNTVPVWVKKWQEELDKIY